MRVNDLFMFSCSWSKQLLRIALNACAERWTRFHAGFNLRGRTGRNPDPLGCILKCMQYMRRYASHRINPKRMKGCQCIGVLWRHFATTMWNLKNNALTSNPWRYCAINWHSTVVEWAVVLRTTLPRAKECRTSCLCMGGCLELSIPTALWYRGQGGTTATVARSLARCVIIMLCMTWWSDARWFSARYITRTWVMEVDKKLPPRVEWVRCNLPSLVALVLFNTARGTRMGGAEHLVGYVLFGLVVQRINDPLGDVIYVYTSI